LIPLILSSKSTVFRSRLSIMIGLRETLPVIRVPKELHIATMRNNVINQLGGEQSTIMRLEPIDCDRVRLQICRRRLLPAIAIPSLS
jgi:hypothetical protein